MKMNHVVRVYTMVVFTNSYGKEKFKPVLLETIPCYSLQDAESTAAKMKEQNSPDLCYRYECNGSL